MISQKAEFYSFFGTMESVEKEIFKMFLEKTVELLQKNKDYETYDMKSKMLSFYFTFFELLSANRSYVTMSLKQHHNELKNLMQLSGLRNNFKNYVTEIITDEYQNYNRKNFKTFRRKQLRKRHGFSFY